MNHKINKMKKFNIKSLFPALLLCFIFIGCDIGIMGPGAYSPPEPPGKPVINYPLSTDTTTLTPTIKWSPVTGTSKIQLSKNSNFTDNFIDTETSGNSYPVGPGLLQYDTYYYLHIKIKDSGEYSDWSETVRFKTKPEN